MESTRTSEQTPLRGTRNPRRLSIPSRVIIGLDASFAEELQSDDDDFFGSDNEQESCSESVSQGAASAGEEELAEQSHVTDVWSSGEEEEGNLVTTGVATTAPEPADTDITAEEISSIQTILNEGCGCTEVEHIKSLCAEELALHRKQFGKLSLREKDLFLSGLLANASRRTQNPSHSRKSKEKERERVTYEYSVMSHGVCRAAFMKLYDIGRTHLKRLQNLVATNVFFPELHGNVGCTPHHAFPTSVVDHAVTFIKNHAQATGLPMPAAPRGRAQDAPTYLPASSTYSSVHSDYKTAAKAAGVQVIGYQSFIGIWKEKCPSIKFMKPREDVCARCEQYRADSKTAKSEEERVKCLQDWKDHIHLAQDERQYYNDCTVKAVDAAKAGQDSLSYSHLTFDFAENFALPHHARQPGPVFFKVLFRVNDFGVMNAGQQKQHHYLYTEAQCIGADNSKSHGPNSVISMLHHYLEETQHARDLHLHCDNCVGQNKNKSLMAYMAWRILVGKEDSIAISFMVVGHTRCAVDGGFGLAKKKFRSSDTDTFDQLATLVSESAVLNESRKSCEWLWRDWDSYLQTHFKKIAGITKFHHFSFSAHQKGAVSMKATCRENENVIVVHLLKDGSQDHAFCMDALPPVLPAGGMSALRRDYLEKQVMQFCRPENRESFKQMLQ